jgi:hypothetical protein
MPVYIPTGFEVITALAMKNGFFWDIKNAVRTSRETHLLYATESSRLMLCKV